MYSRCKGRRGRRDILSPHRLWLLKLLRLPKLRVGLLRSALGKRVCVLFRRRNITGYGSAVFFVLIKIIIHRTSVNVIFGRFQLF